MEILKVENLTKVYGKDNNKVVALDALMDEAKAMANKIIANAPIAVKLCKEAINRGMGIICWRKWQNENNHKKLWEDSKSE